MFSKGRLAINNTRGFN